MEFDADLFYLLHVVEAVGEDFCDVESWHIPTNKTQPGYILIIDRRFATYFEDFWTVYRVAKLELLHVDFNTNVR